MRSWRPCTPPTGAVDSLTQVGDPVERLELADAWFVDPVAKREGPASLLVEAGRIAALSWRGDRRDGTVPPTLVLPGLLDLHAHFRQPGGEAAETIASGLQAAAHGGFTAVCLMPNTTPPADNAAVLHQVASAARESGSPVLTFAYGATTAARSGAALAPLAELADAGAAGFSDDGAPVADPALLRHALTYAAALGLPVVEHPEEPQLTSGAEAHEGLPATILGLRGWPVSGEAGAVARDLAILADVVREVPAGVRPRLHLTHLSCGESVELVRRAKAAGLPVTCDVTPHHLALHDGWLGGDRRFTWEVGGSPWAGGRAEAAAYDPSTRVNPPLRSPDDALALARGLADGTIDAIATDHAPRTTVEKAVEFGDAAPGISGIETALGLSLRAVEAGLVDLRTLARALTVGPAAVLPRHVLDGATAMGDGTPAPRGSLQMGAVADLVVVDRTSEWVVTPETLLSKGKNSPLLGRRLQGRVLLTVAQGRFAYLDPEIA
jgi:dihydroorotase